MLYSLLVALVYAPAGAAATVTVLNGDATGPGSLRQALLDAAPGDTINFDASLSGATIRAAHLGVGLLLTKNVVIDGSTLPSRLTITGDADGNGVGDVRVMFVEENVTATLKNLIITRGRIASTGAGILNGGTLTLENCEVSQSVSTTDNGGGVYSYGPMTATGSVISGNTAGQVGGGLYVGGTDVTLTNTTISGNNGPGGGGGIFVAPIATGTLSVTGGSIANNTTLQDGGGILNQGLSANLSGTRVTGNTSTTASGGGLAGSFVIDSSVISNNTAAMNAGGIYADTLANVSIRNSTLAGNQAGPNSYGGAILNRSLATTTLVNTTLSGNSGGYGGGIYNQNNGVISMASVTLANNQSPNPGGIGGLANVGVVHFVNTLIAGSTNGDCAALGPGSFPTRSGNLIQEGTCFGGSAFLSVMLGPLADNGGPTQTHALLPGSPAIDYGDNSYCDDNPGANNLDQRGVIRPVDGDGVPGAVCDTGAFELAVQTGPMFANGFE
ncbi:MAG: choice-of-anchor Q domain-containing protein [Lysobacterales bacterium]